MKHLADEHTRGVVPYRAHDIASGADCCDVLGDIRGTAKSELPLSHVHNGNWSLWRDAVDVTAKVNVEHRIADNGNAFARGGLEERNQPLACDCLDHSRGS